MMNLRALEIQEQTNPKAVGRWREIMKIWGKKLMKAILTEKQKQCYKGLFNWNDKEMDKSLAK